jgi:hypothetical protein
VGTGVRYDVYGGSERGVTAYFSVYRINGLGSIPDLYASIVHVTSKVLKLQEERVLDRGRDPR